MPTLNPWRPTQDLDYGCSADYDLEAIGNRPAAIYQVPLDAPKPPAIQTLPIPVETPEAISQKIVEIAQKDLFYTIPDQSHPDRPRLSVLNLSTMNRIVLHTLQHSLATYAADLQNHPESLLIGPSYAHTIHQDLKDYCEAIKNMSLMQSYASVGPGKDPFKLTSDSTIERAIMTQSGLIPDRVEPRGVLPMCSDAAAPRLVGTSRSAAIKDLSKQQMLSRLVHAFGGGFALIVPLLIMVYVDGTAASVATTCVSMGLFAFVIALKSNLSPNEVLAVTSAYAAVLVVFVGVRLDNLTPK